MKTIFAIILPFCAVTCMQAQVTYFGSNNYFLNLFTNTGFSSYDWRFEPLKTDLERGWLKGDVAKVVTTINDNASLRGSGTLFADTTYYNRQGNITKIVAPILDNFFFDGKNLRPDTWLYEYNANGKLKEYTKHTANQRHVHTMQQDGRGNIVREIYPDYVTWSWGYDTNGTLMSGATHTIGGEVTHNLKYQNGQLISMSPVGIEKPGTVTYTYAPNGRMASMKYFFVDGYDDEVWYIETTITLSYNDKGDIIQAVREEWNNTSKWVRKQQMGKSIYNITYTYDDKDNWTRAVMSRKSMYGGKTTENTPNAITVTRAITYGQASASTSPATNITLTNYEVGKGKKSGKGVLEWSDGSRYEGDVKNGMRNGQGKYTYANGDIYLGGWKDDMMHGKGIYRFKNGDMYEGDYMNGERTGQGIFTYADTMKYVGQFKKGLKDGFGTLTWADGSLYEGYWVEDNAHGRGKLTLAVGYVYDGEWADGQMNGEGVILLPDGTKFKGHFKNGMKNGKGVEETPDGIRFEGFFVNDQKDGSFVEKDRTGKVVRQGVYSSGNMDSSNENQGDKKARMPFSACERQNDGQTSNGAYAALDVSLAVPKGEVTAQRNVARGIRAICDRSPVAEKLGKAPIDASIEGIADYYVSAFKKGLRTGKVYPLCTYSLRICEKFQNRVGVVFSVTTGVWGNGGPWEYDTFVRFSDSKVLDSKYLVKIPAVKIRALVQKYASEELSSIISVEEGDYQVMPATDGKANLHVSMGSHFFENVEVPVEEVVPYLTAEGKAVFEVQTRNTSVAPPVPADAQNCRKERLIVMNGGTLYPYNVVCGSFDNIDEANNLRKILIAKKYSAQVALNPDTGRYRVIAASFDNYASVVQARNKLQSAYPNAWLLYRIY